MKIANVKLTISLNIYSIRHDSIGYRAIKTEEGFKKAVEKDIKNMDLLDIGRSGEDMIIQSLEVEIEEI